MQYAFNNKKRKGEVRAMKRKVMGVILSVVMAMTMSMTAFAASSTTANNSGNVGVAVEVAAPGAVVKTDSVSVAVSTASGVKAVTLTEYVKSAEDTFVSAVATTAGAGADAGEAVSKMLTKPATPMFQATINTLGGKAAINNCGTVKTAAVAKDAFGNTIASAGTIKGITAHSLVMLMSVNADGVVEFVEGVVDPATGLILGAFQGTPKTITVLVFVPGK